MRLRPRSHFTVHCFQLSPWGRMPKVFSSSLKLFYPWALNKYYEVIQLVNHFGNISFTFSIRTKGAELVCQKKKNGGICNVRISNHIWSSCMRHRYIHKVLKSQTQSDDWLNRSILRCNRIETFTSIRYKSHKKVKILHKTMKILNIGMQRHYLLLMTIFRPMRERCVHGLTQSKLTTVIYISSKWILLFFLYLLVLFGWLDSCAQISHLFLV